MKKAKVIFGLSLVFMLAACDRLLPHRKSSEESSSKEEITSIVVPSSNTEEESSELESSEISSEEVVSETSESEEISESEESSAEEPISLSEDSSDESSEESEASSISSEQSSESSEEESSSQSSEFESSASTSEGGEEKPWDSYYKNVNGSQAVSGNYCSLLESICTTINDGAIDVSYSGLWNAYKTTDIRSDGCIYDIYSNMTKFKPGTNQCGSYGDIGDCYNREHSIPKSWWGGAESKQGSDLYIVIPSDGKINGMRSNYPYGETTTGTEYRLDGDPEGNRLGQSTSTQYVTGKVFEPFDDRKGDLARIIFYAVARYLKGGASNGAVKNWTTNEGSSVFGDGSSCTNYIKTNYLQMLLKWHREDPVSIWEITRNSNGQSVQKNRNPFIDHPSWVDVIWGGTYGADQVNGEELTASSTISGGHVA